MAKTQFEQKGSDGPDRKLLKLLALPISHTWDAEAMVGQGGRRGMQGHPRQKTSEANQALGGSGGPPPGDFLQPCRLDWLKIPS